MEIFDSEENTTYLGFNVFFSIVVGMVFYIAFNEGGFSKMETIVWASGMVISIFIISITTLVHSHLDYLKQMQRDDRDER